MAINPMHTPAIRLFHAISILTVCLLTACAPPGPQPYQGYIEGEYVYIASPIGGTLEDLAVRRGQWISHKDLLFRLDETLEAAGLQAAQAELGQAQNRLADLQKGLRDSEIKAIAAGLASARLRHQLAEKEYKRRVDLYKRRAISREELDKARTEFEVVQEQIREIEANLETARLGARTDEIRAAQDQVTAAQARLAQAHWQVAQKTQTAPLTGQVFDTFFLAGEWVAAGQPVLALLSPEAIKIRFFVPQPRVGALRLGQPVTISYDGLQTPISAQVTYISPQVEYTPPIIYSSQQRAKLVFLIEAVPTDLNTARHLHPGQPVDVMISHG